ncbi:hypothetical protein GQ600_11950 [Phytophthora cactorum]|nr:hypothetical protein GQ600_11950 [Phytophthora cactorum]
MPLLYLVGLAALGSITSTDANLSVTGTKVHVPSVSNWATSAADVSTTRLLRTSNTDDDERAGLSVPTVEKLKTWFTSSNVNSQQLQNCLNEGKFAETVFARMKLTNAGLGLLYDSQFSAWLQYVDDLNAKTSQKGSSAISTLTSQYGDDKLYEMIDEAKTISRTHNLATRLQADQMEHWLTTRKDPDEVFHLFKLDKEGKNILNSPEFTAWSKYVDDLNINKPEQAKFMIPTLRKYYRDVDILKMVESAKSVETTKSIASKLENEMIKDWLVSRKTPDKALVELGFGMAGNTLLKNPLLNTLTKYVDAYNAIFPKEKTTMVETFTRKFGDEELNMWLSNEKSANDVFELLKLYLTDNDFTHNPLLDTWVAYVNAIVMDNPNKMSTLFSSLETRFSDRPLLESSKQPRNGILSSPLFQTWKNYVEVFNKKHPNHQESWFDPIHINYIPFLVESIIEKAMQNPSTVRIAKQAEREKTLASPKFKTWAKYLNDFNHRYPDQKTTMIDGIRANYYDRRLLPILNAAKKDPSTEKLATNLQNALIAKWIAEKKIQVFAGREGADEMIQRLTKKLNAMSESTS